MSQGLPLTFPPLIPSPISSLITSPVYITTPVFSPNRPPTPLDTPVNWEKLFHPDINTTLIRSPRTPAIPRDPFITPPNPSYTSATHNSSTINLTFTRLDITDEPLVNPFVDPSSSPSRINGVHHLRYSKPYYHLHPPNDLDPNFHQLYSYPKRSPCPRAALFQPDAMAVQTRRTARRADENAAPALTRLKSTASVTAATAAGAKPTNSSSIPVLKRTHSSATATAPAPATTKPAAAGTKRSALGVVTNAGSNDASKALKGKEAGGREKRALQQTSSAQNPATMIAAAGPARRTRSSMAGSGAVAPVAAVEPAAKRRTTSRIPVASRSRSTTASTSTTVADGRLKERKLNVAIEREVVEPEPARKKRKTSSPAVEEVESEDDLADEGLYDEDGREVVLSSGGRGTRLRSPERVIKAKDAGWTDLDAEDDGDPTMVSEYVVDAFNYMLSIEVCLLLVFQTAADPQDKSMPDADYMNRQAELTWDMRTLLMDWMIEVHSKFRLLPETLLIAVNMIDRFLSQRVVSLEKLQLVGMTALFISAKYEEVICPSITHFLHMAEGGFVVEDMCKAERYMLSTLDFDLSYPNPLHFLRRISKADGYDIQTRTLAKFLIEIMCVEAELIKYKSSLLAAAGTWLARLCLDRGWWSPNLVHYSTYSVAELLEPAQIMVNYLVSPDLNTDGGFYKKYASKKHMKSSVYIRHWALNRWPESAEGISEFQGRELVAEIEGKLIPVMDVRV